MAGVPEVVLYLVHVVRDPRRFAAQVRDVRSEDSVSFSDAAALADFLAGAADGAQQRHFLLDPQPLKETCMANVLLIESRDSFDVTEGGFACQLARTLARERFRVQLLLLQNGVLTARAGARAPAIVELLGAGIDVLADAFSLRERGIAAAHLARGIKATELDIVIDRLADGWQVIWH